ncbi:rRNA 2'-O-methyltransferase fibrillarin-like [Eucalyptus grandis]|uniref:rRNA 2'-O-methyltransferase fibrillarin-like n=1 Tax=Eucalyptus grandis TaxID=71139 RepID=UPI00192ED9A9|nr:rRNA 2'-O-methyltransferase fibrillarin-like [Eucalyptus grandis]
MELGACWCGRSRRDVGCGLEGARGVNGRCGVLGGAGVGGQSAGRRGGDGLEPGRGGVGCGGRGRGGGRWANRRAAARLFDAGGRRLHGFFSDGARGWRRRDLAGDGSAARRCGRGSARSEAQAARGQRRKKNLQGRR